MKTTYYFKVSLLPTGNELLLMLVVAQLVKNPPIRQETWVWSLGWEDPLEKGMTTHSSILAWRVLWTLKSMGSQRVGHNWVISTFTFHFQSFNATSSSCIFILLSPFCLTSEGIISLAYAYPLEGKLWPTYTQGQTFWIVESSGSWEALLPISEGDGVSAELFKILKDYAIKVLHKICQQIWNTQQWPQDWKRSVLIPIPKKRNTKECANHETIALIAHAKNHA